MGDTFDNPYPKELGFFRIGTPINADLNRANPACPAFEMPLLEQQHCLLIDVNSTSTQRIQASGFDTKSQDAWGFSVDSSIKLGCFVTASLSAHVNRSRNLATSASGHTVTAYAKQEREIVLRENVSGDVLLACSTDDFREKLQAIRTALTRTTPAAGREREIMDAYRTFYRMYGTGFVSTLILGAIGVFRGSASYESAFDETKANYGGGMSVSGIYGGASVASEYTTKAMRSNARGVFHGESFGMPDDSSAAKWAQGFLNQFAGKQLADIAKLDRWQAPFDNTIATAAKSEIKSREPAGPPPKIPSFTAGKIEDQIKDLKLHEFVESWKVAHPGETPDAAQYQSWVQRLKDTAAGVTATSVAASKIAVHPAVPAGERVALALAGGGSGLRDEAPAEPLMFQAAAGAHEGALQSVVFGASGGSFDDVDFGGYGVIGYRYTPWERVFPELAPIKQDITASQVSIGLAMAWLSVREQFAEYLGFCAKYFGDVAPEGTSAAANAFRTALTEVSDQLLAVFTLPEPGDVSLPALEQQFRERLAANRFTLMAHYQLIIDNYDWLRKVPFGAVPIVELRGKHYYQPYTTVLNGAGTHPVYTGAWIEDVRSPAATLLERGALRLYPIIATDRAGRPFFFWTNVEVVTLAGKDYRVGASMLNYAEWHTLPGGRTPQLDWGMCRVRGEAFTPGHLLRLRGGDARTPRDVPHVQIVPDDVASPVWQLQHDTEYPEQGPFAMVYTKDPHQLVHSGAGSITEEDLRFVLAGMNQAPIGSITARREVRLVPIGYEDARNASEPPNGLVGGTPMWFEPRTDQIIEALHALAR